jgi:hypothetical protein
MGNKDLQTDFPLEGVKIRRSCSEHCYDLVDHLRPADIRECLAHDQEPLDALLEGYSSCDECFTILKDDQAVAMFGCGRAQSDVDDHDFRVGWIWLLGSDRLLEFRRTFLRQSRLWVDYFQEQYDLLTNVVDIRNETHVRWLDWMGFTILQTVIQHNQHSFYRFVRYTHQPCASPQLP